jgi:hypothetical protein
VHIQYICIVLEETSQDVHFYWADRARPHAVCAFVLYRWRQAGGNIGTVQVECATVYICIAQIATDQWVHWYSTAVDRPVSTFSLWK